MYRSYLWIFSQFECIDLSLERLGEVRLIVPGNHNRKYWHLNQKNFKRMLLRKSIYLFSIVVLSCNFPKDKKEPKIENQPYPDKEWSTANLNYSEKGEERMDSLAHVFNKKFSLLIIKNGSVIFERYQAPYLKDTLIHVNSCTKSVISILFGMVFKNDLTRHENKSSLSYFPQYPLNDSSLKKIKNKHFLSMSSGLDWKGGIDATDVIAMSESDDWTKYVFERKVIHEPHVAYRYNSGGTQVISTILHSQTSDGLEKFAVDSLFSPLNIESYFWDKTLNGVPKAGWGLHLKMADIAKLGYLLLRNGRWKEKQLIPKYWVEQSTTSKINISDTWDYGYQFWIPHRAPFKSYLFRGYYPPSHKIIEVIPELDIVAVYVGENSNFKEVIKSHIEILEEEGTQG